MAFQKEIPFESRMIQLLNISQYKVQAHGLLVLALVVIGASFWGLERLGLTMATWLALASLPLVCAPSSKKLNKWWLGLGLLCSFAMISLKLSPFYFLSASALLLTVIGLSMGQQGLLPYLMLGFASSVFGYIAKVFGFPIRLRLSEIVAQAMQWIGADMQAFGNVIRWRGHDFAVDEACMGLHLTEVGMVLSLAIVGYQVQQQQKRINAWWSIAVSLLAMLLLLFTNLSRIAGVVLLQSPPNSLGHELIGLFSLGIYTLLPILLLSPWLVRLLPAEVPVTAVKPKPFWGIHLWAMLLVAGSWYASRGGEQAQSQAPITPASMQLAKEEVRPNIWKLSNDNTLIYLKTDLKAYKSSHSPMVCWQGSGYQLNEISIEQQGSASIYKGKLVSDETVLYTAWWYASNSHCTIGQLDWRWHSLIHQESYQLINITCASAGELTKAVQIWIKPQKHHFNAL